MSITFPRTDMGNTYHTFADYAHACAGRWTDSYGLQDCLDVTACDMTARHMIVRRYAAAMIAAINPADYDDIDLMVEDMMAVQA